MLRDMVDCWIDDYSHMVQQAEQEQREHEEACDNIRTEIRMVAKLIEFQADKFNDPTQVNDEWLKAAEKFVKGLNIDLRIFRDDIDA